MQDFWYFVARKEEENFLRSFGLKNVKAVGLPFAYALQTMPERPIRKERSLLVLPGYDVHEEADGSLIDLDVDYIKYIDSISSDFSEILVVLRMSDFDTNRAAKWNEAGYRVHKGAGESDSTSLRRMAELFSSYEFATTNGFSSAIPYAAAAGCRTSVAGPRARIPDSHIFQPSIVRMRPELARHYIEFNRPENLDNLFADHGLVCPPASAIEAVAWGMREIGADCSLSPEEFSDFLLGDVAIERPSLLRLVFRGVKDRVRKLLRFIDLMMVKSPTPGKRRVGKIVKNLYSLSINPRGFGTIHLTDTGVPLLFRPHSSDLDNVYQHFVEEELGQLDLGDPRRILDVGSYAGYSLEYFRNAFPEAEIVGVEPHRENFSLCQRNHAENGNVTVLNRALWSSETSLSMVEGVEGDWSHKVTAGNAGGETTQGADLPSLLQLLGWSKADVIKIDIEGGEYEVLPSIAPRLHELCDVLLIEFHHQFARQAEYDSIVRGAQENLRTQPFQVGEFTVFDFR